MSTVESRLDEYLYNIEEQFDAGMIIAESDENLPLIRKVLEQNRYICCEDWRDALSALGRGQPTCYVQKEEMPREMYQLFRQYRDRGVMLQIQDEITLQLHTIHYDPLKSTLLCLSGKDALRATEQRYPILDQVGFIERI